MRTSRIENILVGLMVIVSLGLFIVIALVLGKYQQGKKGFEVSVEFNFLNNLGKGAPVLISGGIKTGYVKEIYQKDLKTYVRLYLDDTVKNKLPKKEGMTFSIFTTGLMGQKYINLTIPPVEPGDTFLQDGDIVRGQDPPSVDQMILAFSSWFKGKNGGQVLAEIMQETQRFINNLNSIAQENRGDVRMTISQARESIVTLSAQLDSLMVKLNVLTDNFSEISTQNKRDIQIMLANMSRISRDLNLITQRINSGRGTVGKFVADEALYNNATEALANARDLLKLLNEKPYLLIQKESSF